MRVAIAYGTASEQTLTSLELEEGATIADALRAARDRPPFSNLPLASMPVGVFGRPAGRDTLLKPGDRVELYRPLVMDPREARRRRAR